MHALLYRLKRLLPVVPLDLAVHPAGCGTRAGCGLGLLLTSSLVPRSPPCAHTPPPLVDTSLNILQE